MKRNIYILGNGFDLHHQLPTSLQHFQKIIAKKDEYGHYQNFGVYWTDFEEDLSNLNVDDIASEYIEGPDYMSDRESDRDGVIWQMEEFLSELTQVRKSALEDMVKNAVAVLENKDLIDDSIFNNNDIIINFNYTPTVEILYECMPFYIHGRYDSNDLIFGFKNDSEEFKKSSVFFKYDPESIRPLEIELEKEIEEINKDSTLSEEDKQSMINALYMDPFQDYDYYIHEQGEAIYNFYKNNKKQYQYEELKDFLSNFNTKDEYIVYVLGHQMGEIDKEYFEYIERLLEPIQWNITQYNGEPCDDNLIRRYSFSKKIKFTTIKDLGF